MKKVVLTEPIHPFIRYLCNKCHNFWGSNTLGTVGLVRVPGLSSRVRICNLNSNSLDVVKDYFPRYALQDQELMGSKESVNKVLALVPEDILFLAYSIFTS